MKPRDIRKLSDEELGIEIARSRQRLFELRAQSVTEKIHDTSRFSKVRKDIARFLTEQNARGKQASAQQM